jgi:hypothetical protein
MPEAATVAAAPIPAPLPTPTPAPAPAPSPSPAPAPAAAPPIDLSSPESKGVFDELDAAYKKLDSATTTPGDAPPAKPATPAKPDPKPTPTPPPKPAAATPAAPQAPKELRAELERVKAEHATSQQTITSLNAKIAEYEARGKDTEGLRALLEKEQKEKNDLQGQIRALRQEASPEFKKQYEEPFNQAAEWAREYVEKLTKADGTPANFEKDFVSLYQLAKTATIGTARTKAEEIFGAHEAVEVMDSIKELVRLDRAKAKAFEAEKAGWEARTKEEQGKVAQKVGTYQDLYKRVTTDLQSSVPEYRDPVEDKELAEARSKGREIFSNIAKNAQKVIFQFGTPQDLQNLAHMQERVAAFVPQQLTIKRLNNKIADLEKQIAELKPATPGGGETRPTGGETTTPQEETLESWGKALKAAVPDA